MNDQVVVNFSTGWCSPCRTITRTYIELADKYSSLLFLTVDVDSLAVRFLLSFFFFPFFLLHLLIYIYIYKCESWQEFSSSWDIKATPTFLFLRNGREVDKLVGSNKDKLLEKAFNLSTSTKINKSK